MRLEQNRTCSLLEPILVQGGGTHGIVEADDYDSHRLIAKGDSAYTADLH